MTIINWQDSDNRFIFKRNADSFLKALQNRGHEIVHQHTSIDGMTTIIIK